jgi:hypothetical protein
MIDSLNSATPELGPVKDVVEPVKRCLIDDTAPELSSHDHGPSPRP